MVEVHWKVCHWGVFPALQIADGVKGEVRDYINGVAGSLGSY
jgi:hypothetical protein